MFTNPLKLKNSEFFNRELKENPEFFKAFPHLQQMFDESKHTFENEYGEVEEELKYVDDKMVNFSGMEGEKPYFNSLLDQHKDTMMTP